MSLNKWLIGCACSSLLCLSAMSKETKCVGDDCKACDEQNLSTEKTPDASSKEKEAVNVSKEADKKAPAKVSKEAGKKAPVNASKEDDKKVEDKDAQDSKTAF